MSYIQNLYTSRDNNANSATYVGQQDRLWWDPVTNAFYGSDGNTAGGIPVGISNTINLSVNTITANSGTINGDLDIVGNISAASNVKIGGVRAGPGANISNDGLLTIDTAGLPLSFGDFTANVNILTLVNVDQDMILATQGNAEVQLVGNIGFYKPDGLPLDLGNRYFYATDEGIVHAKYLDIQSFGTTQLAAPFNVTIDPTGNFRAPAVLSGSIAQFTGNSGQRSFVVQDNYGIDPTTGTGGEHTFRTARGTVDSPSAVQSGDTLGSIVATGWASNGYGGQASGFYKFVANENFTSTARGGRLEMWVVPNGTITETKIVTVDSTGITVSGMVSATGNITGGNVTTAGLATVTGNITGGNVLTGGVISATGNITTANTFVGNLSGLVTHRVSNAGAVGGTTLTLDVTSNDLVHCTFDNNFTVAFANIIPGRVVTLIATNSSAGDTDIITAGISAVNMQGDSTLTVTQQTTAIVTYYSTGTTTGAIYASAVYG